MTAVPNNTISPDSISLVRRGDLNTAKWDACVTRSPYGVIYATTSWLDNLSRHWDALIFGDYEYIMPLTWNKKYGIRYLYQPPFSAELGIIGTAPVPPELIDAFIKKAQSIFKFAEIYFNHGNPHPQFQPLDNYELDLSPDHATISEAYKQDLRKNLHRARRFLLRYDQSDDFAGIIDLHRQQYQDRMPHIRQRDFDAVLAWCLQAEQTGGCMARTVTGEEAGLLSSALLLRHKNRMYLLMTTTPSVGRKTQAHHFLMDSIISEFAEQDMVLDFVGSSVPGIAHFYENFGALNRPYYFYRFNHLPWPLRLLKR